MRRGLRAILFGLAAIVLAAGCAFFTYYTVRLAYVNLTVQNISRQRQPGMYIGAVAFPVASSALGYLSFRCTRAIVRAARAGQKGL
jgi:hypothetical protein